MKRSWLSLPVVGLALAGCGTVPFGLGTAPAPSAAVSVQRPGAETLRPEARPSAGRSAGLGQGGQSAEALDGTTAQDRAAARSVPSGAGAALGETLASLGSPTEQGFWLRTGLVTRVQQGRVELADNGGAVRVELRPSGAAPDAGSQLSLAAFRALDAPLTQLVSLRVFAD